MRTPPALRSPKFLKRRRKRLFARSAAAGFAVFAALIGFYLLFRIPAVRVSAFRVTGAAPVEAATVTAAAEGGLSGSFFFFFPHSNTFFYPRAALARKLLSEFPQFADVAVGVAGFRAIGISVTERVPAALWCEGAAAAPGACYLMDGSGYVFAPAPSADSSLRFFGALPSGSPIGGRYFASDRFSRLRAFAAAVAETGLRPEAISWLSGDDFILETDGGPEIIFSETGADPAVAASNLKALFANGIFSAGGGSGESLARVLYVDLRFNNKVFYKLKNGAGGTTTAGLL